MTLRLLVLPNRHVSRSLKSLLSHKTYLLQSCRLSSHEASFSVAPQSVTVEGKTFESDNWTNVTPKILSHLERKLHQRPDHPLGLIKSRIVNFIYSKYRNHRGNPLFSVYDNLSPGKSKSLDAIINSLMMCMSDWLISCYFSFH